jgi:hypothetical protein
MNEDGTGTVGWLAVGSRRRRPRRSLLRYLALFVIVMCGVAGGMLLANWITGRGAQGPEARIAEKGASVAATDGGLADKAGHVASKVGSEIKTVLKQVTAKVKAGRSSSETEADLKQQCDDWTRAYQQGQTETARAEMVKHCKRYEAYLAAGGPLP